MHAVHRCPWCALTHRYHLLRVLVPAGIVENGAFVVYLKLKNRRGTITYYLPLIQE
jgi:hypothetical protein